MTPTLVERLKTGSDLVTTGEVVAEIERLQAELARAEQAAHINATQADELQDKLDRLTVAHAIAYTRWKGADKGAVGSTSVSDSDELTTG